MTSDPDDQLRSDVERWLRSFVEAAWAMSGAAVATVGRCVRRRMQPVTDRVAEPMRVVRSIVELAARPAPPGGDTSPTPDGVGTASSRASGTDRSASVARNLPIDEYESLAASQVVARLGNLTPAELRRVRRFEVAHRGRRTVIGRIDQLLGNSTPS